MEKLFQWYITQIESKKHKRYGYDWKMKIIDDYFRHRHSLISQLAGLIYSEYRQFDQKSTKYSQVTSQIVKSENE